MPPLKDKPKLVTVNLTAIIPHGHTQMIFRVRDEDKFDIQRAAAAMDMKLVKFTRTVLVNAARKILAESGLS